MSKEILNMDKVRDILKFTNIATIMRETELTEPTVKKLKDGHNNFHYATIKILSDYAIKVRSELKNHAKNL